MNKERKVIEPNAVVVFDRDVKASELDVLFQEFKGDIVINGDLIFDGEELSMQCDNLYVMGEIAIEEFCNNDIWLSSNLYVEGSIECTDINVNGCICCMGSIDSYRIDVAEDLYVEGKIDANYCYINVGGELICQDEIEAAEIVVLQKMHVKCRVKADSISVG